jgi:cysteine-rich repeat protein
LEVCGDGVVNNAGAEACDDGNTIDGDGCSSVCTVETLSICGDASVDPGEECDDGNTENRDGCTYYCRLEDRLDLTNAATIIARVTEPQGQGSRDLEVIRDNDYPPVGSTSDTRQYDTFTGGASAAEDWIGYEYSSGRLFSQVVFQEGRERSNGGFFLDVTVQVRSDGVWAEPSNLKVSPAYQGANGVGYDTYVFDFDNAVGDAIRIHGTPGGSDSFISVGELRIYGPPSSGSSGCRVSRQRAPIDPIALACLLASAIAWRRRRAAQQ